MTGRENDEFGKEASFLCRAHPSTVMLIEAYCARHGYPLPTLSLTEFGGNLALHAIGPDGCHFSFSIE